MPNVRRPRVQASIKLLTYLVTVRIGQETGRTIKTGPSTSLSLDSALIQAVHKKIP